MLLPPHTDFSFVLPYESLKLMPCMPWLASRPPPSHPTLTAYCNNICELQVTPLGFRLSNTKSFVFLHKTCLLTIIFLLFGLFPNGPPPFWVVKLRKRLGFWSQTIKFYLLRWEPQRVWFLALGGYNKFQLGRMTKLAQKRQLLLCTGHSCSEVWPLPLCYERIRGGLWHRETVFTIRVGINWQEHGDPGYHCGLGTSTGRLIILFCLPRSFKNYYYY